MRYDERPLDDTPSHTAELPPTPVRDRNIPATACVASYPVAEKHQWIWIWMARRSY